MIIKEEIERHWQIQEHLLQNYRLLFLSSQTMLVCTGAIITVLAASPSEGIIFSSIFILAMLMIQYWRRITNARGLDVSFLQGMLYNFSQFENKESLMQEFKNWQKLARDEKLKKIEALSIEPSQTRMIMERKIPALYFTVWIILLIVILYKVGAGV